MEIADACKAILYCNDALSQGESLIRCEPEIALSVKTITTFLERVRNDGKPIAELDIPDHLLCTPEGIRWVMPFVLSVEAMLALERRRRQMRQHPE